MTTKIILLTPQQTAKMTPNRHTHTHRDRERDIDTYEIEPILVNIKYLYLYFIFMNMIIETFISNDVCRPFQK